MLWCGDPGTVPLCPPNSPLYLVQVERLNDGPIDLHEPTVWGLCQRTDLEPVLNHAKVAKPVMLNKHKRAYAQVHSYDHFLRAWEIGGSPVTRAVSPSFSEGALTV